MAPLLYPRLLCLSIITLVAVLIAASNTDTAAASSPCPTSRCGETVDVKYPFWISGGDGDGDGTDSSHCGYAALGLECRRGTAVLRLPSGEYAVNSIQYTDRTLRVIDMMILSGDRSCPDVAGRNVTLPAGSPPPLALTDRNANCTIFLGCPFRGILPSQALPCLDRPDGGDLHAYVVRGDSSGDSPPPDGMASLCSEVVGIPFLRESPPLKSTDDVTDKLASGFELTWTEAAGGDGDCAKCEESGGYCGQRRDPAHGRWVFSCVTTASAASSSSGAGAGGAISGTILWIVPMLMLLTAA